MVIPPGWNVTEPIALAGKLYHVVQSFRSASEEARSFAFKVDTFRSNLNQLQKELENPSENVTRLKPILVHCQNIVEKCEAFDKRFKELNESNLTRVAAGRLTSSWVWNKETAGTATKLRHEIDSLTNDITVSISIDSIGHRRQGSMGPPPPNINTNTSPNRPTESLDSSTQTEDLQQGVTPAEWLGIQHWTFAGENISPTDTSSSTLTAMEQTPLAGSYQSSNVPSIFSQRPSQSSSVGPTSQISRRNSHLYVGTPSPDLTMDNLSGVSISYYKPKSRTSFPCQKIEFVHNQQGKVECIISTLPAKYNIRLYQHISQPARLIPHSEHPVAYGNKKVLRVKFLELHLLTSQNLSNSPDEGTALRPSYLGTPDTLASTGSISSRSTGSSAPSTTIGSFTRESRRQEYDFESEDDYNTFQERIVGKSLLQNAPVSSIASKRYDHSSDTEGEDMYLRLWQSARSQSIMFHANMFERYREYNIEYFRPVDSHPSSKELRLDVHLPGIERQKSSSWSLRSNPSSPTFPSRRAAGKQKEPVTNPNEDPVPEELKDMEYLVIEFTRAQDKKLFLEKAEFHGIPDAEMLAPLTF